MSHASTASESTTRSATPLSPLVSSNTSEVSIAMTPTKAADEAADQPQPQPLPASSSAGPRRHSRKGISNLALGSREAAAAAMHGEPPAASAHSFVTVRIALAPRFAGCVLGHGGQTVTQIRRSSGAAVDIATYQPEHDGKRIIEVEGELYQAQKALKMIVDKIAIAPEPPLKRPMGTTAGVERQPQSLSLSPPAASPSPDDLFAHLVVFIPPPLMGILLGHAGKAIKQMRERSGATMFPSRHGLVEKEMHEHVQMLAGKESSASSSAESCAPASTPEVGFGPDVRLIKINGTATAVTAATQLLLARLAAALPYLPHLEKQRVKTHAVNAARRKSVGQVQVAAPAPMMAAPTVIVEPELIRITNPRLQSMAHSKGAPPPPPSTHVRLATLQRQQMLAERQHQRMQPTVQQQQSSLTGQPAPAATPALPATQQQQHQSIPIVQSAQPLPPQPMAAPPAVLASVPQPLHPFYPSPQFWSQQPPPQPGPLPPFMPPPPPHHPALLYPMPLYDPLLAQLQGVAMQLEQLYAQAAHEAIYATQLEARHIVATQQRIAQLHQTYCFLDQQMHFRAQQHQMFAQPNITMPTHHPHHHAPTMPPVVATAMKPAAATGASDVSSSAATTTTEVDKRPSKNQRRNRKRLQMQLDAATAAAAAAEVEEQKEAPPAAAAGATEEDTPYRNSLGQFHVASSAASLLHPNSPVFVPGAIAATGGGGGGIGSAVPAGVTTPVSPFTPPGPLAPALAPSAVSLSLTPEATSAVASVRPAAEPRAHKSKDLVLHLPAALLGKVIGVEGRNIARIRTISRSVITIEAWRPPTSRQKQQKKKKQQDQQARANGGAPTGQTAAANGVRSKVSRSEEKKVHLDPDLEESKHEDDDDAGQLEEEKSAPSLPDQPEPSRGKGAKKQNGASSGDADATTTTTEEVDSDSRILRISGNSVAIEVACKMIAEALEMEGKK